MLGYARLTPGHGFSAGRATGYYAQRMCDGAGRRLVARGISSLIRARHPQESGEAPADAAALERLEADGIARLPGLVPQALARRIFDYFGDKPVVCADGTERPLGAIPERTAMASYALQAIVDSPDVMALLNAPRVLGIAGGYLGCKPTLSSVGVRWSFPGAAGLHSTQRFHRDRDDWAFLKLFIYLTNVTEETGPHAYMRGTHRQAAGLRHRFWARSDVEERYGADRLTLVTGRRGTAFIADTYGIHAGLPPLAAPRLILQAQYSLLPVYALDYQPLRPRASLGVDPYINRLIVAG